MDNNPSRTDAHPLSEKQTNTEDNKLSTTAAILTDPTFPLPTLTKDTSAIRYVLSFGMLFMLLGGGILGAWFIDIEILQIAPPAVIFSCAFAVVLAALFFTGTVWIDWYELVLGYWWLSIPVGGLAGLALVLNQEATAGIEETA